VRPNVTALLTLVFGSTIEVNSTEECLVSNK
jgi:hypothetical protein